MSVEIRHALQPLQRLSFVRTTEHGKVHPLNEKKALGCHPDRVASQTGERHAELQSPA
jgi:hypothetical protein